MPSYILYMPMPAYSMYYCYCKAACEQDALLRLTARHSLRERKAVFAES